jgi:hypothetical protein
VPRAKAPAPDPDPDEQEPTPAPSVGDSSPASSVSEFLSDPGPEFDPAEASSSSKERDKDRALSVAPGGDAGIEVQWDPKVMRGLLKAKGAALHSIAGKAENDWAYTSEELDAISVPLTNILNRYDATRAAAGTGDELAAILGLSGYAMRSIQERKPVIKAEREAREQAEHQADQFGLPPQPPIQEPPIP